MTDRKMTIIIGAMVILLAMPCLIRMITGGEEISNTERTDANVQNTDTYTVKENTTKSLKIPENALGIIEIPGIKISYSIFEGATEAELSKGIGHMPETADLLSAGNCVLCGHNGSRKGVFFTNLSRIRKGDKVNITTKDLRSRTYSVVSTRIVGPYDETVTKQSKKEVLTLFTCAYHGSRRLVAICELLLSSPYATDNSATTAPQT